MGSNRIHPLPPGPWLGQYLAIGGTVKIRECTLEELLGPLNDVERKNAPKRLFVSGDISTLQRGARVSIVGTRKPSVEGTEQARRLAAALASAGVVVVSGLAEGVDTAAHEGALGAGGATVAVLGTPLDKAYPAKNRALQDRISHDYLTVSQFPTGTPTLPMNFPMRNRTMALISDATIIVEAGEKSGTLHQGWEALRLGRPLFILDLIMKNQALPWPKEMIRYGAQPLSTEDWNPIMEFLPERSGAAFAAPSF